MQVRHLCSTAIKLIFTWMIMSDYTCNWVNNILCHHVFAVIYNIYGAIPPFALNTAGEDLVCVAPINDMLLECATYTTCAMRIQHTCTCTCKCIQDPISHIFVVQHMTCHCIIDCIIDQKRLHAEQSAWPQPIFWNMIRGHHIPVKASC